MRVTVLNGNPDPDNAQFDDYLRNLTDLLESRKHKVAVLQLRDMDIRYCIGCFGCWVKTPGECSNAADSTRDVRREYISSDFVLFASPVIMGFTSSLLKIAHERLLPLLLPYSRLFDGERLHVARYDRYPSRGMLLQPQEDTDEEDIKIITDIYRRDANNFRTSFPLARLTSDPIEEVADAIDCI